MINIQRQRAFFRSSNGRLRRARRLYVAICLRDLERYGNPVIDLMAQRAQERGLYSDKTNLRSIRQSINGHHYRLTMEREKCGGPFGWHNWCKALDINPWKGYYDHKKRIRCST